MSSSSEKLIYMANQIGKFFAAQRDREPVEGIAEHIRLFWEPRMRTEIFHYLQDHAGKGLDPLVLKAIQNLHDQQEAVKSKA
jgi:formate dehydrogenase subunit delta